MRAWWRRAPECSDVVVLIQGGGLWDGGGATLAPVQVSGGQRGVVMVIGCHGDYGCSGDGADWAGTLWMELTWSEKIIGKQFFFLLLWNNVCFPASFQMNMKNQKVKKWRSLSPRFCRVTLC